MTVSIVGALVIGQAAVEAGLISNIMVIIVSNYRHGKFCRTRLQSIGSEANVTVYSYYNVCLFWTVCHPAWISHYGYPFSLFTIIWCAVLSSNCPTESKGTEGCLCSFSLLVHEEETQLFTLSSTREGKRNCFSKSS